MIRPYLSCCLALAAAGGMAWPREHQPQTARIAVHSGQAGCQVYLDADPAGATDATGKLIIPNVEPGDHYVHVRCPGKPESSYFLSPKTKEEAQVVATQDGSSSTGTRDPATLAEDKVQLRRLVQQAVQLRAQARLDEAVASLHQAMKLDPENSDLHRELGITFLLAKEWKRARVEMIEAIRCDQSDADAHNGLGYALEKLGDIDGAVKEYRTASQLEPDDPTYRTHYLEALAKIQARQQTQK